jgi:hypothetical protein
MKSSTRVIVIAALVAAAGGTVGCTIVAPGGGNDGGTRIVVIRPDALPPPKSLEASVLYVANLQRSSANLATQYASIMLGLDGYLESLGLQVDNMGLISTYADQFGPRLLLGKSHQSPGSVPPISLLGLLAAAPIDAGAQDYQQLLPYINGALGNIGDGDLPVALKLLAASGSFDGDGQTSEAKNLIDFGRGIDANALPPALGGIDRGALFDRPHDLFIVVYLQPVARRCALGSVPCQVDGRAPEDILLETGADGGAAWLNFAGGTIRPEQVVHVSVATSEGENVTAFRARCGAVPGFPRNLFDVIEPSPNPYFTPLMAALNAAHRGTGHAGDLCELMSSSPDDAIRSLGNGVAAVAGSN